ncbi:MAG TPA: DUF559 domain-containing protein [Nocardioidaceae bacterium]|nr:DUF559 domain-containing protein [Nocardioidaceae bacterium]
MSPVPFDPARPFTTRHALAAGVSPGQLRGPGYRRLAKGVHVGSATPLTPLLLVQAALVSHPPDAFASHHSAAVVYGLPVPPDPLLHVSVFAANDRRRRRDVTCHLAPPGTRVLTVHGTRVPLPAQVLVELAAQLPLVDLVVVGDAVVRKGWYSPDDLVAFCAGSSHPHAGRALDAARHVRAKVDSPMETRLRMLLVLAGLLEPQVNLEIRNELGDVRLRFDLSYPEVRVAVEYDGRQHAESTAQHNRDLERREEIDNREWRIVVVTADGIYRNPEHTLKRVAGVLRDRGLAGVPPRFDERWRAHFPGRTSASGPRT